MNNIVIVLGGQGRSSVTYTRVSILPKLASHPHCHGTGGRVPWAVQQVPVGCPKTRPF